MRTLAALLCLVAMCAKAEAAEFALHGYGDLRIVAPPHEVSYLDGGLGKFRFGGNDRGSPVQAGDIVLRGDAEIVPNLFASATARLNPSRGADADLLEAEVTYNADTEGDWRWSIKAGAFFPPNAIENDQIGWTSLWTITPSAIDSWMGSELRIIGLESSVRWRRAGGDITLTGAVFGWNDPAGVLIANRGWTFDDRPAGLFEKARLPDATALAFHAPVPLRAGLFSDLDSRPGYYLDLQYDPDTESGIELMRYDNLADPAARNGNSAAWHTDFWSLGLLKQIGHVTLMAQGMTGTTEIRPLPGFETYTDFRSAYVLAGWDLGDWLVAGRIDLFQTRTAPLPSPDSEDGVAGTAAITWLPAAWFRLTLEVLTESSKRPQRLITGGTEQAQETQVQLLARVFF